MLKEFHRGHSKVLIWGFIFLTALIFSVVFSDSAFAADADTVVGLFEEARTDLAVQEANTAAVKPAIKLFSIAMFILGLAIIAFSIWHLGDGSFRAVRAKGNLSKERIVQLAWGLVVGLLFIGGGAISFVGFADKILTQPLIRILGS